MNEIINYVVLVMVIKCGNDIFRLIFKFYSFFSNVYLLDNFKNYINLSN